MKINLRPTQCNLCSGKVVFTSNAEIYGKEYGSGKCYLCTNCGAYVGTHKPKSDEALGLLSNKEMREMRIKCHSMFDGIWNNEPDTRRQRIAKTYAYTQLASRLNITIDECYFGYFDLDMLNKAYEILLDKDTFKFPNEEERKNLAIKCQDLFNNIWGNESNSYKRRSMKEYLNKQLTKKLQLKKKKCNFDTLDINMLSKAYEILNDRNALGLPTEEEKAELIMKCRELFDNIWKSEPNRRKHYSLKIELYKKLAQKLQIKPKKCYFDKLSVNDLFKTYNILINGKLTIE